MLHRAALAALASFVLISIACDPPTARTVASALSQPVYATAPPGDTRVWIVERAGRVLIQDGGTRSTWIDLTGRVSTAGEAGLMSIAFAPDFESSGDWFAYYTTPGNVSRVSRFTDQAASSEVVLVEQQQTAANHKGGTIAFGPDGLLYWALGDGERPNDARADGTLLGKLVRFDPDDPEPEIYARGLRNPFRFSFDRETGDLWIADVGAASREEINLVPAGTPGPLDFGWPEWEGTLCRTPPCTDDGEAFPVYEYTHAEGCSITGGVVSRGGIPWLGGVYLFSDLCSDRVWGLLEGTRIDLTGWTGPMGSVVSITEGGQGELLFVRLYQNRVVAVE